MKLVTKTKLGIIALAAFGMTSLAAASADAKPYRPGPGINHSRSSIPAQFRALDKNHNGVLTRADFLVRAKVGTKLTYKLQRSYKWKRVTKWQRTRKGWKRVTRWQRVPTTKWIRVRVPVYRTKLSPKGNFILHTADKNHNGVVTYGEFLASKMPMRPMIGFRTSGHASIKIVARGRL